MRQMNTAEVTGHVAMATLAGSLVLFLGPVGVIIGVAGFAAWIFLTSKKEN